MSLALDEHRQFLADSARLTGFEAALSEVVRPDAVVLDLGAGTGILGLLACRAGARRVYAVDAGGMIQVARELSRANGFADRIVHLNGLSTHITLPEPVDVVVADQIGCFGFEAGVIEYFADARRRLMKPDGRLVPSAITFWIAPVEAPEIRDRIAFWTRPQRGFDLTAALPAAMNTEYPMKLRSEQLLGEPAEIGRIELTADSERRLVNRVTTTIEKKGTLHGIGGWFCAQLSDSVTLTNSPRAAQSIDRRNVIFPIAEPVTIGPGDRVSVTMNILASDAQVAWRVDVTSSDGQSMRTFSHSTWRGMLLCPEDLRRLRPDHVPTLSPWGLARRSVLELCDGGHSTADIEASVFVRHRDLFHSAADAARFVAEVLIGFSE